MSDELSARKMKHIVMYSGGVGSFITADLVAQKYGTDNLILLFADVLMEDEDLYRFNSDVQSYLGIKITTICEGRNPWQVQIDAKYGTNTRIDPCSRILKRELMDAWVTSTYKPEEVTCYVGIDASEAHRIEALAPRKLPFVYEAPMVEAGIMLNREQKITYCRERGFEPPQLYLMGFHHNNCGGGCMKAGLAQWELLWRTMPERYLWHEQQQRELLRLVPKARPFLRKTENKVTSYLWLWEFREKYLEGPKSLTEMDLYDWGGCGCAIEEVSGDE